MPTKWISWFEEISQDWNDVVGKKCANLGAGTAGSSGVCAFIGSL
ncbi:MAG: hypothetical protein P8012_15915 [Desulfobacterales bacterium]